MRFLAGLALVATLAPALAACNGEIIDTQPVEPAEFGAVTLVVEGGVGGIRDELLLQTDGTVLVRGTQPVGGRAPDRTMRQLKTLLTSDDIAVEAADGSEQDVDACADGFTYTLRMQSLQISRYDCVEGIGAPIFGRVLELLEPLRKGTVDPLPAPPAAPALPALAVTRTGGDRPDLHVAVQPDGTIRADGPAIDARLEGPALDALRLLAARLVAEPPSPPERCGSTDPAYVVEVAGGAPVTVSACGRSDPRQADGLAIVHALDEIWDRA
jgi:hypothetical protein